ncbi:MAG: hypothetical protein ACRETT_06680 [Steroidobacteraceae bacterium]
MLTSGTSGAQFLRISRAVSAPAASRSKRSSVQQWLLRFVAFCSSSATRRSPCATEKRRSARRSSVK